MKRSKFNLSHHHLATFDMGQLIPIGVMEVLPGDTVQMASRALVRATPMATPPMHNVYMKIHHWFVPYRLVWVDWENFITGGPDGDDQSVFPTITLSNPAVCSLADYLGVPPGTYSPEVSALLFRAYALVCNENYRDQDLVSPLPISTASGADATTNTSLFNVAWQKDRFTTARPWEQKGPDVSISLGSSAPVNFTGSLATHTHTINLTSHAGSEIPVQVTGSGQPLGALNPSGITGVTGIQNASVGLGTLAATADLSNATAVSVNELREAMALQRFAEARARYGSRYTEYLRYLGVRSSDSRLQRPEYLGGGTELLNFSEVLQTAPGSGSVGDLYGHGIGSVRSNRYRRFFEEHGVVLSVMYVLPETMYPQGLFKHWLRRTREDFWQQELQHIGQEEIDRREVYALASGSVFGYQDRYDEYRRMESQVHGEFRTTYNDWHFARIFSSAPGLNSTFVQANPAKRPFVDQANNVLLAAIKHQIVSRRLVSKTGSSFIY